ncbi:hypothetical protein JKF63_07876 [Porcisia hertigi]|uniref:non-specific serine/threonine protein kinase n=1 Tax=Porcisia hertigi TaxID=2761500 RepID=A0A836LJP6_9TRYP|nr:hypothetical protein JKF63_07876 [Porcisia hertigi]
MQMAPSSSPLTSPLPPATPAAPWRTLNESLLPYPVFYPAIAVLNNSMVLLGGCVTATCATPVGNSGTTMEGTASAAGSPYHERVIALNVELGTISALSALTLPAGLGFAGRYAAVTLTDSIYVVRSCTMSTQSPEEIYNMKKEERQALQAAYAPVVAFYPSGASPSGTRTGDTPEPPAVNLTYFEVPANRVRVNASCTVLATENKVLIIGGFLLSAQRVTASVDSFDVVTRQYDTNVAALNVPVLQPSVATSTGFAAVAGGWTYERGAAAAATKKSEATPEAHHVQRSNEADANGEPPAPPPNTVKTAHRNMSRHPTSDPPPSQPVSSPALLQPAIPYLFDLLFFEPNNFARAARASPLNALRTGTTICASPVDPSALPSALVDDILLSVNGCHVAVFGGQVVLADHNLDNVAVLDVRATSLRDLARAPAALSLTCKAKKKPAAHASVGCEGATRHKSTGESKAAEVHHDPKAGSHSCYRHDTSTDVSTSSTADALFDTTSSSSSSSSQAASASSSSIPTSTLPPPVYRYAWMRPALIAVPHALPPDTSAASNETVTTDTVLLYYALGGEDLWTEAAAGAVTKAAHGASESRLGTLGSGRAAPLDYSDVVVRRVPALRWAQRQLPDMSYDSNNPEVLAVKMPTPVWPDALTLKTTTEGTVHLSFPDVDYTRYCTWEGNLLGREDNVVCAVRLSSRRDCVGNTAGTLDSAYNGAPNATILFSASGSTTPVYVCFGYMVQPTSWSVCRTQRSFSILNPMMPLRILDNSPTNPPTPSPTPSPTRDPADQTTSSPLFLLTVGVAVVTLLVAVLLVARLDHVPDDGLLVNLLDHGPGAGEQHASSMTNGNGGTRRNGRSRRKRLYGGSGDVNGTGLGESWMLHRGDAAEGADKTGVYMLSTYAEFLQALDSAQEQSEERMLAAASEVLRLHQHRYRVLSRIGQGEHSLCFLALRKAPPQPHKLGGAAAGIGGGVRALGNPASAVMHPPALSRPPLFPVAFPTRGPTCLSSATTRPSATANSSLWVARHDQNTAVVIKYTQCPDDATRAVITRLCERLRDLHADAVTAALGAAGVYRPHRNAAAAAASRHSHRRCRPSAMSSVSGDNTLQPSHVPTQALRGPPHDLVSSTGSSGDGATTLEAPAADAGGAAVPLLKKGGSSNAATFSAMSHTGCPAPPSLSLPVNAARMIHGDDDDDDDDDVGSCAWLDAHEVNVVLSLFLLLPEDLFVSYEVSVLHQKKHGNSCSQHAHDGRGDRLTPPGVSRAAVEWNRRHLWPGPSTTRVDVAQQGQNVTAPSVQQSFLAQSAPRVCWAACINPLPPSSASPWSLCLVMPYEHHGDLAGHILSCQQAQLPPAEEASTTGTLDTCRYTSHSSATTTTCWAPIATVHHCWTESLLCSVLFQVCTGLQLLHAQSPPILHGNIKQTNVLLREPATFSVARRRVVAPVPTVTRAGIGMGVSSGHGRYADATMYSDMATAATAHPPYMQPASEGGGRRGDGPSVPSTVADPRPPAVHTPFWRTNSLVAAAAAAVIRRTGSPVSQSLTPLVPSPLLNRGDAAVPPSVATDSHGALKSGQPQEYKPLRPEEVEDRCLLSTQPYLPISLTDGGMSWWLTIQLPQRLRGCFGNTTHSTLRQTPAGLCWLRRSDTTRGGDAVPSDDCIAALAHFLFAFIEVPPHVAPELLWGRLCTLTQSDAGHYDRGPALDFAASSSSAQPLSSLSLTHSRREQWARSSRRDCRQGSGGVSRGSASFPPVGLASLRTGAPGDEIATSATEGDKQTLSVHPENQQPQPHTNPCAGEDMDDEEVVLEVEEDDIFTREEVSALTSAMWKAEGLTRVSRSRRTQRRAPSQQHMAAVTMADLSIPNALVAAAAMPGQNCVLDEAIQLPPSTIVVEGVCHGGGSVSHHQPPSTSPEPPVCSKLTSSPAGASSSSSPQGMSPVLLPETGPGCPPLASANNTLHPRHHDVDRQTYSNGNSGSRPLAGGGDSGGGGGSHSSSGVYELLIRRILAMDTASDVWSVGILLYGMCVDALDRRQQQQQQQQQASSSTMTKTPNKSDWAAADSSQRSAHKSAVETLSPAMLTCTGASRFAQRAFAALLGDLYSLSIAGVPSGDRGSNDWTCNGNADPRYLGGDAGDGVAPRNFDEAADDRLRWPRSCALEDEVMRAFRDAGYSHPLAATLSSMLSPVAARRPSASDIVDRLRLVIEAASATDTSRNTHGGSAGFTDEKTEYPVAQQGQPLHGRHMSSASDPPSAVILDERVARMALCRW